MGRVAFKKWATPLDGSHAFALPSPALMMNILEAEGGGRPQPGSLLPTIELVVTVLGDHRRGDAAGLPDENP